MVTINPNKKHEVVIRHNDSRQRKNAIQVSTNHNGFAIKPGVKTEVSEDCLEVLYWAEYGPAYEVKDENGEVTGYERDRAYNISGYVSPFDVEDEETPEEE